MKSSLISLAFVAPVVGAKVVVEIMGESFCPCSAHWHASFSDDILPLVGEAVELRRFFDHKQNGTQGCCNPSAGPEASCMHTTEECRANAVQMCAQKHYPEFNMWLDFTICANGPCSSIDFHPHDVLGCENSLASRFFDEERLEACASSLGMNWAQIRECWEGEEGIALAQIDANRGDAIEDVYYGKQGLPVVWVGYRHGYETIGKVVSTDMDCAGSTQEYQDVLVQAICEAAVASGTRLPDICAAQETQ